jgi:hypothetical protein
MTKQITRGVPERLVGCVLGRLALRGIDGRGLSYDSLYCCGFLLSEIAICFHSGNLAINGYLPKSGFTG